MREKKALEGLSRKGKQAVGDVAADLAVLCGGWRSTTPCRVLALDAMANKEGASEDSCKETGPKSDAAREDGCVGRDPVLGAPASAAPFPL